MKQAESRIIHAILLAEQEFSRKAVCGDAY